jgi:hypothetical protein
VWPAWLALFFAVPDSYVRMPAWVRIGVQTVPVLLLQRLLRCEYHVGADGLLVKLALGSRFIPWSDVLAIEPHERGIILRLLDEALALPVSPHLRSSSVQEREKQSAFLARATEALAAYRSGSATDAAARLARRGRTRDAWLRDLSARDGDYREAPLPDDRLWQVVEAPTATDSARAAAALVIARGQGTSDADRARLRIAAEACASPRLRVVLDKAASGAAEAEVEAALAEVEDEARAPEKARA